MGTIHSNIVEGVELHALNAALGRRREEVVAAVGSEAWGAYIVERRKEPGVYDVRSTERNIATFALAPLPGCCGVVVSYYASVLPELQKKGFGRILLEIRMDAARRQGYGLMMATVLVANTTEINLLIKEGWKILGEFRNPKSNNLLVLLTSNL